MIASRREDTFVLRSLDVSHAPEMICALDEELRFVAVNAGWSEKTGLAPEELGGKPLLERVHPADHEVARAAFGAVLQGKRAPRFEVRFRGQDNHYLRLQWSAWASSGEGRIHAVVRDMTEEHNDLAIYKMLADRMPYLVSFAMLNGQLVYVNEAGMRIIGRSGQDPTTLTVWDVLDASYTRLYQTERIPHMLAHGSWAGEVELRRADGELVPMYQTLVLLRDEAGEPALMATTMHDLTLQKEHEAELHQFKAMLDAMPDFVAITSSAWKLRYINPGGMRMIGREGEDRSALTMADLTTPDVEQRIAEVVAPTVAREGIWTGESAVTHVSGERIPLGCTTVGLRDARGALQAFAMVARDLRPQQQLEHALREAIRAMSTPIIQVWEGVLALPVIGVVNDERAAHMTEALLAAIAEKQCRMVVLDLTGVEMIDASTLVHIFQMVRAARLLGSRCVISGISANSAQAITHLDLDLTEIETFRSLREALMFSIRAGR